MRSRVRLSLISGFTLIELLIVVAIIAILAAIAVPNFLEAQTRAKVSRVKADMRSFATAIEAYLVDNNKLYRTYRPNASWTRTRINSAFTSPIAYITSVFPDPFNNVDADVLNRVYVLWGRNPDSDSEGILGQLDAINQATRTVFFTYYPDFYNPTTNSYTDDGAWFLFSLGPDQRYAVLTPTYPSPFIEYDPTNGTISPGDIIRWKGKSGR
jgi:prepilin-type N-terminal cleavage/methylation domain-containing protein